MPLISRPAILEHVQNRRGAARRRLRLEALGTTPAGEGVEVFVHNLSESGLLLESAVELFAGDEIMVDLPAVGPTPAGVIWSSLGLYGCKFREPISAPALSAAQLRSSFERASPMSRTEAEGRHAPAVDGARVRELRLQLKVGVGEFASRIGVSRPTVWAWETGHRQPAQVRLAMIAKELNVEVVDILVKQRTHPESEVTATQPTEDQATLPQSVGEAEYGRYDKERIETKPVARALRLTQLIAASKLQISEMAGITPDRIKIILEM